MTEPKNEMSAEEQAAARKKAKAKIRTIRIWAWVILALLAATALALLTPLTQLALPTAHAEDLASRFTLGVMPDTQFYARYGTEAAGDIFGDADEASRLDLRFVDSGARADALNNDEVDVVVRTMSITPERAKEIEFSTPYLTSRVRVLVPRDRGVEDINQLGGKTVCIVDGTNLAQIARTFTPHSALLSTRSWSDCLMATQQFQADAIMADDSILAGLTAQDPYVTILPGALATQYYGVGVAKGETDLVRQVNATLERMRGDGTWSELYSRWLGGSIAESAPPPLMYRKEEG